MKAAIMYDLLPSQTAWMAGTSPSRAPLSQVGSAVKKSDVLRDREPVRHAGDVVGDGSRAPLPVGFGRPFGRHRGRVAHIGREQAPYDRVRLLADLFNFGMPVHAGDEKRLDVAIGHLDRG